MSGFVALGALPAVEQFRAEIRSITERPDAEKMALLMLRRSNEIAKAAVEIGRKVGWPAPSKADWRSLIACKLVKRDPDRGVLVLTSTGLMWQQRLAYAMAKLAGLHLLMPHSEDRFNVICRCTCGWSAALSKNEGHLISGQFRHFGQHVDAVAKGLWKPPRSVDEIVDSVMARRAATLVPAQASEEEKAHA